VSRSIANSLKIHIRRCRKQHFNTISTFGKSLVAEKNEQTYSADKFYLCKRTPRPRNFTRGKPLLFPQFSFTRIGRNDNRVQHGKQSYDILPRFAFSSQSVMRSSALPVSKAKHLQSRVQKRVHPFFCHKRHFELLKSVGKLQRYPHDRELTGATGGC